MLDVYATTASRRYDMTECASLDLGAEFTRYGEARSASPAAPLPEG